jgi:hypothetical protein
MPEQTVVGCNTRLSTYTCESVVSGKVGVVDEVGSNGVRVNVGQGSVPIRLKT